MNAQRPLFAALLAAVAAANAPPASGEPKPDRPNVVLFLADDHGALDSGPYGNQVVRTPNLDRLAREGLRFDRAFAASPTCVPSRAALYTGLMPFRNGAHANHSRTKEGARSLPHYLQEHGYRVALAGKVHVQPREVFPFEYLPRSNVQEPGTTGGLRQDVSLEAVESFVKGLDPKRPFCLVVGCHSPHVVWPEKAAYDPDKVDLPPTHVDTPQTRKARARYYTDVAKADAQLGAVLRLLKDRGLEEDTLFVYTADNGPQWPFAKWTVYDAGLRVPLLARWPGRVKAGTATSAMVSLCDLTPTLLEATGARAPDGLDGKSFLPVLLGKAESHRDAVFATHTGDGAMNRSPARCVRTGRYKYVLNLAPEVRYTTHIDKASDHDGGREYWPSWVEKAKTDPNAAAVVKRYHDRPREELYDLEADPHEVNNLADRAKHAEVLRDLRDRLAAWRKQQGDDKTGPEPLPR